MLLNPDIDGSLFLGRDGKMFEYILGFLRNEKLCLPSDLTEFDSLTKEVDFFNISKLSQCRKKYKQKKIKVRYLEILETNYRHRGENTILYLKGKKEDLKVLPLTLVIINEYEWRNADNSPYLDIMSYDKNARLLLAEHLRSNGWTCETSNFSSSTYVSNSCECNERHYRDLWKK